MNINSNNLLAEQQYGFRSNHSTENAAAKFVDHISKEMESDIHLLHCIILIYLKLLIHYHLTFYYTN